MLTVGYIINKIQARIVLATGGAWLAWGLYSGGDPLGVAWRAMLGVVIMSWASGHLLRIGADIITKRLQELEEQQLAEEAAAARVGGSAAVAGEASA